MEKLNNIESIQFTKETLLIKIDNIIKIDKSKFRFLKFDDFNKATTKAKRMPIE